MTEPKIKPWITRKIKPGPNQYFSIINKFTRDGKIDGRFVEQLAGLSLEDVIALKLEQANRMMGGRLYGVPLYHSIVQICKSGCVKYATSCARSFKEAASFLGINENKLDTWMWRYGVGSYFEEEDDEI